MQLAARTSANKLPAPCVTWNNRQPTGKLMSRMQPVIKIGRSFKVCFNQQLDHRKNLLFVSNTKELVRAEGLLAAGSHVTQPFPSWAAFEPPLAVCDMAAEKLQLSAVLAKKKTKTRGCFWTVVATFLGGLAATRYIIQQAHMKRDLESGHALST